MKKEQSQASEVDQLSASPARRSFLESAGRGSLILGILGFAYQSLRSLVPNVLYEPPRRFKLGTPTGLAEGMTFVEAQRLFVFKEGRAFHSISAVCTHLGCTVQRVNLNRPKKVEIDGEVRTITFEFHCPCHGSEFYSDGTNYAGPAPRPLPWHKIDVSADDGQLEADVTGEVERQTTYSV